MSGPTIKQLDDLGFVWDSPMGGPRKVVRDYITGRELAVHWGISPARVCQLAKGPKLVYPFETILENMRIPIRDPSALGPAGSDG